MAVDTRSLVYLIDPFWQAENNNGKPIVNGYMEVYVAGTDTKYITWSDWDGARHPFRIPLKSDGRACILVEPQYTYDCYLYDSFGNLACSRLNVSPEIGGDVSVSGLTRVYHDETLSGEGTPYEPLGIVSGGKTYEGIDPIVVNNDVNKISANNVALGLQEPLFFVEDSETACVIGCSAQTEIPSALSGKWDNASDVVIANSAQWSAGNEYEAGSYVDITNNTISVTGLTPVPADTASTGLVAQVSADITAMIPDTSDMATQTWVNEQGFLTAHQDLSDYQTTAGMTAYLATGDSANFLLTSDSANFLQTGDSANFYPMDSNPSGYLTAHQSLDDYATKQWIEDKGYITGIDIQESATWNATTQTVSANSAQWAGGTANPQIPVTGINGITISESGDKVVFEVSGDYASNSDLQTVSGEITALIPSTAGLATEDWVTAQGYLTTAYNPEFAYHDTAISSIDNSALYDTSAHARINTLAGRISDLSSNKLDSSAFSDVSGSFLQSDDITGKQDVTGMTAYQPTMTFGYDGDGAISSINETALAGTTYSAGSGIAITDDVISVDNTIARTADLPNIFIAVYNSTPFSALQEAYAAGKMILCKDSETSPRAFTTDTLSISQGALYYIKFAGILNVSDSKIIDQYTLIKQYYCYAGGWNQYTVTAYKALQSDWDQTGATNIGYIKNKPDLTQYQTTAEMSAYQSVGDYYSASNPSGFITGITYTTGTI